ncbi:MAG: zinc-ribbon domain-containing protein [Actinobacteria bacterium]|nr:zinc-ribbon domain-containing protein [Actinomycetota bacterium]
MAVLDGKRGCSRLLPLTLCSLMLTSLLVLCGVGPNPWRFPSAAAAPPPLTEGWTQVIKGGFTDPNNSYAPTWAKFKDYLYLSTAANESGSVFSGSSKAGGDIWRTGDGAKWEQIGTAGLGNPHNNLFQLIVYHDQLYAISNNINDHGIEIWVTSNGTEFAKIEDGGFGDKNNDWAFPFVFHDRLILAVSNGETGGEIWVSEDGRNFQRVIDGGMGHPGVTGFAGFADPEHPDPVFQGMLYLGVSNPAGGGEIWRSPDGLSWERVAEKGLTRSNTIVLSPDIVYGNQLYAFGTAGGTLDNLPGFDLFRSSDGKRWEQVVDDGFGLGKERNVQGDLVEFKGRLYLTSSNMDPRLLNPANPTERYSPKGFQLRSSEDGKTWMQVGQDGFGASTSFMAGMDVKGDTLHLVVFDYHAGSQLWRSNDGQKWDLAFREPDPNFFQEGGGPLEFKGHFLWISNDLKNGLEIWRTNEEWLTVETTTSAGASTTGSTGTATSASGTGSTEGGQGGTSGSDAGGGSTVGGNGAGSSQSAASGISGGWVALIAVLVVLVVGAIAAVVYLALRMNRGPAGVAASAVSRAPSAGESNAKYCSECGTALGEDAKFCSRCGRPRDQ